MLGITVAAFAAALPMTAHAQASASPLAPVIVTAQKRDQSLQDIPLSVTALTSQRLRDAGVRDIKDLQTIVPGLLVASTSNTTYTTARIRGIGTVGDNPGLESSVGVAIDGVMQARNGVALTDLGELERVEVLKGPQGTLFGKTTSAGLINIVTVGPSDVTDYGAEITAGDRGVRAASAFITGPLGDDLAGRL